MNLTFDQRFPSIDDLRERAKARIPRFAFEYLDGGCNEDVNLHKNTRELREVEVVPVYLKNFTKADYRTTLFGHTYDAPFGVAPVGLQGLLWPNAPEILARAAATHNVPFILSTVTTASIERIAEITEGKAWFQLYHPAEVSLRNDILQRLKSAGYEVLVLLCDVPSFGFRPRDIRNGLSMPPRMTMRNVLQIMGRPNWALQTLIHGQPEFATLKPYMKKGMSMRQLGAFMNKTFDGRMSLDRIRAIRDQWHGKIILKGVASVQDAQTALDLGLDGIIVSNHGGRQLDAGQSSIAAMKTIIEHVKPTFPVMLDSGVRSGPDIARAVAAGADFTFLGRSFMYAVAALGSKGGDHCMAILKNQLRQTMEQLSCETVDELRERLAKK